MRLTRSAKGEASAAFLPNGDLLFTSSRPDAETKEEIDAAQLWVLPSSGGDARAVTALPGGVASIAASARGTECVVVAAELLPGAANLDAEGELRKARKDKKVRAILHESAPVRFWDHDLGPAEPHLLVLDGALAAESTAGAPSRPPLRDLTPRPGGALRRSSQAITPDGSTLIAGFSRIADGQPTTALVAIDVVTGHRTTLCDEPGISHGGVVISRDGTRIAYTRTPESTAEAVADSEIWAARIDGSDPIRLAGEWDRWPASLAFAPDGNALIATADDDGRGHIFRIPLDGSSPEAITRDDYAYASVNVADDGTVIALRSNWLEPPHPVRVLTDGTVTRLATPAPVPTPNARMERVETRAEDGARVAGWLLLPEQADEASPLLLWVHGGPLNSWNAWSWRWAPQLAVAQGYAVLLPDPALSTGYGLDFIQRGWGAWGEKPYTDLMAITDAVEARDDIDETRTAAMGGSFGGYMANWIAGHTDRFDAIVTHASLWAFDQFAGTTDSPTYWRTLMSTEAAQENSPHLFVDAITTPMLVIHGDKDYRVPIGEGLRLWSDLYTAHADDTGAMVHRFLYFPDENHWILTPQHAKIWYQTVFAFLAQHVLGEEATRPELLG